MYLSCELRRLVSDIISDIVNCTAYIYGDERETSRNFYAVMLFVWRSRNLERYLADEPRIFRINHVALSTPTSLAHGATLDKDDNAPAIVIIMIDGTPCFRHCRLFYGFGMPRYRPRSRRQCGTMANHSRHSWSVLRSLQSESGPSRTHGPSQGLTTAARECRHQCSFAMNFACEMVMCSIWTSACM
jgi:hypothetical protein